MLRAVVSRPSSVVVGDGTTVGGSVLVLDLAVEAESLDDALHLATSMACGQVRLSSGPVMVAVDVGVIDGSRSVVLSIHHMFVDGVSWRIIGSDLDALVRALHGGASTQSALGLLPRKTTSFP